MGFFRALGTISRAYGTFASAKIPDITVASKDHNGWHMQLKGNLPPYLSFLLVNGHQLFLLQQWLSSAVFLRSTGQIHYSHMFCSVSVLWFYQSGAGFNGLMCWL